MPARFLVLPVVLLLGIAALFWSQTRGEPLVVSGYLEAEEVRLGSRVGGRVARVLVEEGDRVELGELLVELEPYDLREQLAQAEQSRAAAQARYDLLEAGFRKEEIAAAEAARDRAAALLEEARNGPRPQEIEEAEEALEKASAQLELDRLTFRRNEELLGNNAISREDYDASAAAVRASQAEVGIRTAALSLLREGTRKERIAEATANLAAAQAEFDRLRNGYRTEEIAEARARLQAETAHVEALRRQIDELRVSVPLSSLDPAGRPAPTYYVQALDLRPGDLVPASAPVLSLTDTSRLWVRAYVPEDRLGQIQPGDRLPIGVDSFPERRFAARVIFVAEQAEYTPSNVQTPEERSDRVYRIKVELEEGLDVLRPGMAADVYLAEKLPSPSS